MFYELHLPWPPTVNSYYKKGRYGVRISEQGRKFRAEVLEEVEQQFGTFETIDYRMLVETIMYPPDKRKRDLDNYMKPLLDALTEAGVWLDDSLIDQEPVYRGVQVYAGKIAMRIYEAGPVLPVGVWPD